MNTATTFLNSAIIERVKLVLLKPSECWNSIASETANVQQLMRTLVVPLAVISSACQFLGMQIFGVTIPRLGTWRQPLFSSLVWHITTAVLQIALVFVGALVVEKVAKLFKGEATRERAYSLLAHAMIPGAVGGMLGLVPFLSIFSIIFSILGLFTLYNGSTKMTTVPESSKLLFTLALVVSLIATGMVVFFIGSSLIAPPIPGSLNVS
jgi:ABC-type sugar transport system permease subunit